MEEKKKVTKKVNTNKKASVSKKVVAPKKETVINTEKKVVAPKKEITVTKEKKEEVIIPEPNVIKNGKINSVSLLVQAVLTTYTVLLLVGGLFDELFLDIFDAIASILMFVIAYNNDKIFKHKHLTAVYVIAGILFAGMFLFHIFN